MAMVGIVLLFVGFILVISYPINKKKNARCSMQTQGVLIGIRKRLNTDGVQKDAHIYSYQVDGVEYQLDTVDYKLGESVGDECTIWYNPAKPQDAQAFHGSDRYLKNLLIIGIVLLVLGIVLSFFGCAQAFVA